MAEYPRWKPAPWSDADMQYFVVPGQPRGRVERHKHRGYDVYVANVRGHILEHDDLEAAKAWVEEKVAAAR